MPRLVYDDPVQPSRYRELTEAEVTIGRGPENVISIPGHWVHWRHAVLRRETDGEYRLFDLNSRNGVWMNHKKIPSEGVVLRHGDEFLVADIRCRYRDWEHAPADWERTLTARVHGNDVTLTFREYRHIGKFEQFAEDWDADVIPLLATFRNCNVTADLRGCPMTADKLLGKLRVTGELLRGQGCSWSVQLSTEMMTQFMDWLRRPRAEVVAFLLDTCHTLVLDDASHGSEDAS